MIAGEVDRLLVLDREYPYLGQTVDRPEEDTMGQKEPGERVGYGMKQGEVREALRTRIWSYRDKRRLGEKLEDRMGQKGGDSSEGDDRPVEQ